jgi:L,D-transpeptidase YcbB
MIFVVIVKQISGVRKVLKFLTNGAAIGSLMLVSAGAHAAAVQAAGGTPGAVAASQGAAAALDSFYAGRRNAPLWFEDKRPGAAAAELVAILRRAPVDGLASGPQLAAEVEQAIGQARSGQPQAIARAERLMSAAWVAYVQALRAPTPGMIYGDPGMPAAAPQASIILRDAARARSLGAYLAEVSAVNPIYAALRRAALLEGGTVAPSAVLRANLDRARAIPSEGRFVLVDAAAARLYMYDVGRVTDSMKVIVGKPQYATPMIASAIHYATFNPYWHVPDHLVRETIAANVVKQGAKYLRARGYEVVSDYGEQAEVLPPSSVDWKAVAAGAATVRIRQRPGATNAMGAVKFSFPNNAGIYLHDTPDKALFAEAQRTLSNGCVRLEDAPRLARWLGSPRVEGSRPEQHVRLPRSVPIFITYLTAAPEGGTINLVDDVYGRDRNVLAKTAALN